MVFVFKEKKPLIGAIAKRPRRVSREAKVMAFSSECMFASVQAPYRKWAMLYVGALRSISATIQPRTIDVFDHALDLHG